uniref:Murine leukemia virus integrase C-terminal domain-containing protein n=1 Tax=Oncorhynchus mykiss TaxID=8022 RepID=A0A8K9V432_ONCMY
DTIPMPPQDSSHLLEPGDKVCLKVHQPGTFQPRWTRPHTVLLVTDTAVKVSGRKAWIYVFQVKAAPTPTDLGDAELEQDEEARAGWRG